MAENHFQETISSLFQGMDHFISTKTVVGDPMHLEDGTVMVPLIEVSFGVGAGAFAESAKNRGVGALGGRVVPSSILMIKDGMVRVIHVKSQDTVNKLIDMAPDVVNRFLNRGSAGPDEDTIREAFEKAARKNEASENPEAAAQEGEA